MSNREYNGPDAPDEDGGEKKKPVMIGQSKGQFRVIGKIIDPETEILSWDVEFLDGPSKGRIARIVPDSGIGAASAGDIRTAINATIGGELGLWLKEMSDGTWKAADAQLPPSQANRVDKRVSSQKAGRFRVGDRVVNNTTGEIEIQLANVDQTAEDQIVWVKAGSDPSIDKGAINRALKESKNRVVPVEMILREGATTWEVIDVPNCQKKDRKINNFVKLNDPTGKSKTQIMALEWTRNLDEKVGSALAFEFYRESARSYREAMDDPNAVTEIKALAKGRFTAAMQQAARDAGQDIAPEQIAISWDVQSKSTPKSDIPSIIRGEEVDDAGIGRRTGYDPEVSFAHQFSSKGKPASEIAAAAFNYAHQRALVESMANSASRGEVNVKTGENRSAYASAMDRMVARGELFAGNPTMDVSEMDIEGRELAEAGSAKILRNLMDFSGAKLTTSARRDVQFDPDAGAQSTFAGDIRSRYVALDNRFPTDQEIVETPELLRDAQDKLLVYSIEQCDVQSQMVIHGTNGVIDEQDVNGAVKPPFSRTGKVIGNNAEAERKQAEEMLSWQRDASGWGKSGLGQLSQLTEEVETIKFF